MNSLSAGGLWPLEDLLTGLCRMRHSGTGGLAPATARTGRAMCANAIGVPCLGRARALRCRYRITPRAAVPGCRARVSQPGKRGKGNTGHRAGDTAECIS